MNELLKLVGVNQFYGASHTLWDIDLSIPREQCTCIMGRNGVGKTTLLQCIMGLLSIESGEIIYQGEAIQDQSAEQRAPRGVGYVPQGRQIFPLLSVEENLQIGLPSRRDSLKKIPEKIFELFPVLHEMRNRRGGDLSGGQQQQLAIGRALVLDPKLLILDEPTEGIQPNIVTEIGDVIQLLVREMGVTVLLVEQKLPFARRVADRFCILDRGRKVAEDNIGQLSDELVRSYLTV